ncbi:YcaO-like family protein [Pseudomonas sp. GD03651]|jgi:YcaO cyclodehydratase, ATP-ad Mg2+-binding|uniref:YcaO-like family protein n=1 Tax=Pseudomonas TaxID=286 RepID=UPI00040E554B|nr:MULTISPECIES: YcaO-like family protein [Pseudomonas]MDH2184961.1 YcaO-like family protein [Pseudomonas sp. GD03651]HDS1815285.1 YcaO-like family protein [Pseudomonas putida]HDS3812466.1 YcaO-like family protein [Pseudomonas putida]
MNFYNEIHYPTFADFLLIRPSAVTHFPHSVECGSRWRTYGSSSGWSSDITDSALGEHFERKHFYLDIPVHDRNRLGDGLTAKECQAFIKAFSQTLISNEKSSLQSHCFDRTTVYRVTDFTSCKVPTVCLSISECRNPTDNNFYPIRDTCGCSAHITIKNAVLGAIRETLERQFLLRFWLTKICTAKIEFDDACETLAASASLKLFQELKKSGELCILDLTDERFPGSCILLCYGSQDATTQVKYCAGMAYAPTTRHALEKSIVELWQTFRFMQSVDCENELKNPLQDPYLKHFLSCNNYNTFREISSELAFTQRNHESPPNELTIQNLLKTLRALQLNGYLYLTSTPYKQSNLYLCKYFSPNLFLHMNNANHLNIENHYSTPFFNEIIKNQNSKMVPFP